MKLEKLVKNAGKFASVLALAGMVAVSGCASEGEKKKHKDDPVPADSVPADSMPVYSKTEVQANFGGGFSGKVNYEVCGEIPFNQINYTLNGVPYAISFNDIEMVDKGNSRCFYRESDIVEGENSMTAVADENPNPEENGSYTFTPATEEEARVLIRNKLIQKGYVLGEDFMEDAAVYAGNPTQQIADRVDFSIAGDNGVSVLNYTSFTDDAETDMANNQSLENVDVENSKFRYLPISELDSRLSQILQ